MVETVSYLHNQVGVVHRDLKLENFIVIDGNRIKLIDFGFAMALNISSLKVYNGTRVYMAPEVLKKQTHDGRKSDIFALGVILFIMAVGAFPFAQATEEDNHYKLIIDENINEFWK